MQAIGGFSTVVAAEIEEIPPLLHRVGERDSVHHLWPRGRGGEQGRVARPARNDAGVGATLGWDEARRHGLGRDVGVDDRECRVPPWHEQIGAEVGREGDRCVLLERSAHERLCLIDHRTGAVPVRLGLHERGPTPPFVQIQKCLGIGDVAVLGRTDRIRAAELLQYLREIGRASCRERVLQVV